MKTKDALKVYNVLNLDKETMTATERTYDNYRHAARITLRRCGLNANDISLFESIRFGLTANKGRVLDSFRKAGKDKIEVLVSTALKSICTTN